MKNLQTLFVCLILISASPGCGSANENRADVDDDTNQTGIGGRSAGGKAEPTAAESGQGDASGAPACPTNIVAAEGENCAAFIEGFECYDRRTGPCEFSHAVLCANRVWMRRQSLPAPCND